MTSSGSIHSRLSVPIDPTEPVRLDPKARAALVCAADVLISSHGIWPGPSSTPGFEQWLDIALAARAEDVVVLAEVLKSFEHLDGESLRHGLRIMSVEDEPAFRVLSSVIAGAYLMVPEVMERIGYPGQTRSPIGLMEAIDELETGLLDPVKTRQKALLDRPRDQS